MYNHFTKNILKQVTSEDGVILENQTKYTVNDSFSAMEIYISDSKISYRVYADAYGLAMIKWLQIKLSNKESINNISLDSLIKIFSLPKTKYRNALQLINLIEKINEDFV
ncbi:MAG: hypothetical protein Kow0076_2870 [Francisella sp.]